MLLTVEINESPKHAVCILDVGQILPAEPGPNLGSGQDNIFQPGLEEDLHASMAWFGGLATVVVLLDELALSGNGWSPLEHEY